TGVDRALDRRRLRFHAPRSGHPQGIPGREIQARWQSCEAAADVRVRAGVEHGHSIAAVPALLVPGVECNLLPRMIRVQCGGQPVDWVVEQNRANSSFERELEFMRRGEEWLVL